MSSWNRAECLHVEPTTQSDTDHRRDVNSFFGKQQRMNPPPAQTHQPHTPGNFHMRTFFHCLFPWGSHPYCFPLRSWHTVGFLSQSWALNGSFSLHHPTLPLPVPTPSTPSAQPQLAARKEKLLCLSFCVCVCACLSAAEALASDPWKWKR